MRRIDEIIVHCTATPEGRDVSLDEVRNWHLDRGWSDIGYHFLVQRDGTVEEGRPLNQVGAHCKGHNANSIGIAYVGGMDVNMKNAKDTRTEDQKDSIVFLLMELKIQFPDSIVYGHRDFSTKSCPSFDARREYENISNMY